MYASFKCLISSHHESSLRTQTNFRLSLLFGGDKRQPEIRLRSQAITSRPDNIFMLTTFHSQAIHKLLKQAKCILLSLTTYLPVIFLVRRKDAVIVRDSNDTPFFYIVKSVRLHPVNCWCFSNSK